MFETKLAFVVGVSEYTNLTCLQNQDALNMQDALFDAGFTITSSMNESGPDLIKKFAEFQEKITASSLVLFYFSGHAICLPNAQVDHILLSKDWPVHSGGKIDSLVANIYGLKVNKAIGGLKKARVSVLFLDACRSLVASSDSEGKDGFEVHGTREEENDKSGTYLMKRQQSVDLKGQDTLLCFGCRLGGTARDGPAREGGSPFTRHLLQVVSHNADLV